MVRRTDYIHCCIITDGILSSGLYKSMRSRAPPPQPEQQEHEKQSSGSRISEPEAKVSSNGKLSYVSASKTQLQELEGSLSTLILGQSDLLGWKTK